MKERPIIFSGTRSDFAGASLNCEHCNQLAFGFGATTCGWCGKVICETCRKAYPPVCEMALEHLQAQAENEALAYLEDVSQ